MLIFLLGANRPEAKRLGGRNDQGRNDLGRNAAGAKRLGGELDLGRNDPDSIRRRQLIRSTYLGRIGTITGHQFIILSYQGLRLSNLTLGLTALIFSD